jgi:hypothetical protein
MIGDFGPPAAYDFEATQFVSVFEGEYRLAKRVLAKLEEARMPAKLTFPEHTEPASTVVVVQVMRKMRREAYELAVAPLVADQA